MCSSAPSNVFHYFPAPPQVPPYFPPPLSSLPPPQGGDIAHFGNHWSRLVFSRNTFGVSLEERLELCVLASDLLSSVLLLWYASWGEEGVDDHLVYMFWDSGMFPHAVLVHNRMFIRAGGISLISEPAQFRVTTATLSAVSSNNGWQMPKLFKGADAAFDVWRLLLSIVVQTKGTMLTSGLSAGVLFNKGGADLLSAAVALLMVDLVTILLFSRASLFDIDLSLLLRTAVWDTDEFLDVPGFLRVFAHLITEPREQLSKLANHARERSRVGNFRVVPPPQVKSGLPVIPCISRRLFLCRTR
ncbi:hypothetical protein T05_2668 [Trichinella murrelli]|uniref:Uncharacterized protein n=1 Tax=Trichinella murrelli TaxID=144512 RepID=A0A0V0TB04_9BILA|nr:hypothetical protein T05_2668 [Trichinella murrelli]